MKFFSSKFIFLFFLSIAILAFVACDKEDNSSVDKLAPTFEVDKGNAIGNVQAKYRDKPIAFQDFMEVKEIFPNNLALEVRNGNRILKLQFRKQSIDTLSQFFGTYYNARGTFVIDPEPSFNSLILTKNNLDSNIITGSFRLNAVKRDTVDKIVDSVTLRNGIINITYEGF